jgi:tetratricopeptide (TPR) repeat protein
VRVELANHYLSVKQYRKAQAHAEAAAESGAVPALQCAAQCAEAMEEWPKAEAHVRKLSEQFPDMVGIWMFWCHRTGRGDAAAAGKLVEQRLSQVKGEPTPSELLTAAAYRALTGKPELAPALFQTAHRRKRDDGVLILAASLSDTLQDAGSRERYLDELPITSPYLSARYFFNAARNESEEFVPSEEAMDTAVKRTFPGGRGLVAYVAGMYALRRGETKRATEYLNRAITESDPKDAIPAALAGAALRSMAKK